MIAVGSANPAKLEPARAVLGEVFGLEAMGFEVASLVPDQPIGFAQTALGAMNRARAALEAGRLTGAVYGVGLEGGVEFSLDPVLAGAWLVNVAVIVRADGRTGVGRGASVLLPPAVGARVRAGEELGDVMDDLSKGLGTKTRGGAVGFLTGGRYDRRAMWAHALEVALAAFHAPELYPPKVNP